MRLFRSRAWGFLVVLGLVFLGPAKCGGNDEEVLPIKDLRLPLERYPDGRIKTQLIASMAKVPEKGDIVASDVRVEFYRDDVVDAVMKAGRCVVNRETEVATSESDVHLERQGLVITGKGFECDGKSQVVRVLKDVRVEIDRPRRDAKGALP